MDIYNKCYKYPKEFEKLIVLVGCILKQNKVCKDIRSIIINLIKDYYKIHHCCVCLYMTPVDHLQTCVDENCANNCKIICTDCMYDGWLL